MMQHRLITKLEEFNEFLSHVTQMKLVAFDTEFVSEYHYRPKLCLLQFATREQAVAVDPFEVMDLGGWWKMMADPAIDVVVHGGREEILFCLEYTGQCPSHCIDIQIAEGLLTRGYPLAYKAIVQRVLGLRVHGHETRTDWRKRPLSPRQIDYALEDVKHLLEIWDRQKSTLEKRGRLAWADAEFHRQVDEIVEHRAREAWRRVSGLHRLTPRELAVARGLFEWRDRESKRADRPPRQLLRDDMLIELAHRRPHSEQELMATRGLEQRGIQKYASAIVAVIQAAIDLPEEELPAVRTHEIPDARFEVTSRLLAIALANRCAAMNVAMPLVGTQADLQELVHWDVTNQRQGPLPALLTGWRADVCGNLLTDLLEGKLQVRIVNPASDNPLVFDPVPGQKTDGSG